jgi:hemerythrin superfamily protein
MYEYYDLYKKCAGDLDKQERWARQLIWEVARHAVGEEIVVYPLMEKHLGAEGKRLADEDREQHQVRAVVDSFK